MSALVTEKQLKTVMERMFKDPSLGSFVKDDRISAYDFEIFSSRFISDEDYFQYAVNNLSYETITSDMLYELHKPDLSDIGAYLAKQHTYKLFLRDYFTRWLKEQKRK